MRSDGSNIQILSGDGETGSHKRLKISRVIPMGVRVPLSALKMHYNKINKFWLRIILCRDFFTALEYESLIWSELATWTKIQRKQLFNNCWKRRENQARFCTRFVR